MCLFSVQSVTNQYHQFYVFQKFQYFHLIFRVEYMMGRQSLFSYTIKCKTIAGNDTYVVQKDMQGYSAQYTCLQFVPRDANVVQWRMSSWAHHQGEVSCNQDDLMLSEAPLVYYYLRSDYWREDRNRGKDYVPCPLEGGYIMKWQDSPCNQVLSTLKLENECSPGEGLLFNGLGNGCDLPHRKLKNKYFCLASWQEEGQTYMLLHNSVSETFILKYWKIKFFRFYFYVLLQLHCIAKQERNRPIDTIFLESHLECKNVSDGSIELSFLDELHCNWIDYPHSGLLFLFPISKNGHSWFLSFPRLIK